MRAFFIKLLVISLLVAFSVSCTTQKGPEGFDEAAFSKNNIYNVTLCFDLRDSKNPYSGLILNIKSSSSPEFHTVALPFSSTAASSNEKIYSAWGSYGTTTIINYVVLPNHGGMHSIGFIPILATSTDVEIDLTNLQDTVTLLNTGLQYKFIYKYPDADPNRQIWIQSISDIANTNIDTIAVALPPTAFGVEIGKTGKITIPDQLFDNGKAKFFPSNSANAGLTSSGTKIEAIQVKYQLPPSPSQSLFVEYLIKLIVAFIPPASQLIILRLYVPATDPNSKRKRRMTIILAIVLQILIIGFFIVVSLFAVDEPIQKALGDLVVAFISGLFTAYVLWQDKKSSQSQSHP